MEKNLNIIERIQELKDILLNSNDQQKQIQAIRDLAELSLENLDDTDTRLAIANLLTEQLTNLDLKIVEEAIYALANMTNVDGVVTSLKALLTNRELRVELAALEVLGKTKIEKVTPLLLEKLNSPNSWIQAAAIEALGNFANDDPEIVQQLLKRKFSNDKFIEAKTKKALENIIRMFTLKTYFQILNKLMLDAVKIKNKSHDYMENHHWKTRWYREVYLDTTILDQFLESISELKANKIANYLLDNFYFLEYKKNNYFSPYTDKYESSELNENYRLSAIHILGKIIDKISPEQIDEVIKFLINIIRNDIIFIPRLKFNGINKIFPQEILQIISEYLVRTEGLYFLKYKAEEILCKITPSWLVRNNLELKILTIYRAFMLSKHSLEMSVELIRKIEDHDEIDTIITISEEAISKKGNMHLCLKSISTLRNTMSEAQVEKILNYLIEYITNNKDPNYFNHVIIRTISEFYDKVSEEKKALILSLRKKHDIAGEITIDNFSFEIETKYFQSIEEENAAIAKAIVDKAISCYHSDKNKVLDKLASIAQRLPGEIISLLIEKLDNSYEIASALLIHLCKNLDKEFKEKIIKKFTSLGKLKDLVKDDLLGKLPTDLTDEIADRFYKKATDKKKSPYKNDEAIDTLAKLTNYMSDKKQEKILQMLINKLKSKKSMTAAFRAIGEFVRLPGNNITEIEKLLLAKYDDQSVQHAVLIFIEKHVQNIQSTSKFLKFLLGLQVEDSPLYYYHFNQNEFNKLIEKIIIKLVQYDRQLEKQLYDTIIAPISPETSINRALLAIKKVNQLNASQHITKLIKKASNNIKNSNEYDMKSMKIIVQLIDSMPANDAISLLNAIIIKANVIEQYVQDILILISKLSHEISRTDLAIIDFAYLHAKTIDKREAFKVINSVTKLMSVDRIKDIIDFLIQKIVEKSINHHDQSDKVYTIGTISELFGKLRTYYEDDYSIDDQSNNEEIDEKELIETVLKLIVTLPLSNANASQIINSIIDAEEKHYISIVGAAELINKIIDQIEIKISDKLVEFLVKMSLGEQETNIYVLKILEKIEISSNDVIKFLDAILNFKDSNSLYNYNCYGHVNYNKEGLRTVLQPLFRMVSEKNPDVINLIITKIKDHTLLFEILDQVIELVNDKNVINKILELLAAQESNHSKNEVLKILANNKFIEPLKLNLASKNKFTRKHAEELIERINKYKKENNQEVFQNQLVKTHNNKFNSNAINFMEPLEKKYGLKAVDNDGEGNCFFYAVEHQLSLLNNDKIISYDQLRKIAVNYVCTHRQEFTNFMIDETVEEYITRISQDRQWADHNLIQALSRELSLNIVIISNNHIENPTVIGSLEFPRTIYLGHIVELHYVSLEQINNVDTSSNLNSLESYINQELLKLAQEGDEQKMKANNSNSSNNSTVLNMNPIYNNHLLNHRELLTQAYSFAGAKAVELLLELGADKNIADMVLLAVGELGAARLLEIFFGNSTEFHEINIASKYNETNKVLMKTQHEKTLEAITKIEAIVNKEALAEIIGWHQYISKALSNNLWSGYATKVIQTIDSLLNNLERLLDFGVVYEDIDNQVTIVLTRLENIFDFVVSGITYVGLPRRYPDFDPDDYFGGERGSSGDEENGDNNNQASVKNIDFSPLFVGLNSTHYVSDH